MESPSHPTKTKVAIIGSGNIGTDLMIKVMRVSKILEMGAFVGIDPNSDGLKRAERMGVPITAGGIDGLVAMPGFEDIAIVFDATSAGAHRKHDAVLRAHGKRIIDLTPAAIGPYTIPAINGDANLDAPNVNIHLRRPGDHPNRGGDQSGKPGAVRRDRRLDRLQVGRPGHPGEHRRVHRNHLLGHREGRRGTPRQGDHHPQSG